MKPVKNEFTIVIVGKWNTGIFNPNWLHENIFEAETIDLEYPVDPGLPFRIIGDEIILIPRDDKLIIAPKELRIASLKNMHNVARKLLEVLPHTPIRFTGINYGFRESDGRDDIARLFKDPYEEKFSDSSLSLLNRSQKWSFRCNGFILNLSCEILEENSLLLKFNYHAETENTRTAQDFLNTEPRELINKCKTIMGEVFELELEDGYDIQ